MRITSRCPVETTLEMIGGKWKLPILCALAVDGSTRYNDLKRKLGGISNTMLAKSLKEMEDDGLMMVSEDGEFRKVEYVTDDDNAAPVQEKKVGFFGRLFGRR